MGAQKPLLPSITLIAFMLVNYMVLRASRALAVINMAALAALVAATYLQSRCSPG